MVCCLTSKDFTAPRVQPQVHCIINDSNLSEKNTVFPSTINNGYKPTNLLNYHQFIVPILHSIQQAGHKQLCGLSHGKLIIE